MNNYDENYYERGVERGISGYTNYRWMPKLTVPMRQSIANYMALPIGSKILDYGCAKGYLVKALTELGYECDGTDISEYALSKIDPEIKDKVFLYNEENLFGRGYDAAIAKDVFEHIEPKELGNILHNLSTVTNRLFVAVPLGDGEKYIIPEYESDITHVIRKDESWWPDFLLKHGWQPQFFTHLLKRVKDNWAHYPRGNGFFFLNYRN